MGTCSTNGNHSAGLVPRRFTEDAMSKGE